MLATKDKSRSEQKPDGVRPGGRDTSARPGGVDRNGKPEIRSEEVTPAGEGLVTRAGLAAAFKVSVRTVDRMLAAEEIKPVRMRGWSVRFSLAEVIRKLAATAATRKHGPGKEAA